MRSVNALYGNGADKLLETFVLLTRDTFQKDLIGTFMGIAYGGEVEMCARHWRGCGEVYGYDTFEDGHPTHISYDPNSYEARCMDEVYRKWGREELSLNWQLRQLEAAGIHNAHLVKGLVTPKACEQIDHINLAWLDMDMNESMRSGYLAVCDKIVPGGFLATHDVVPQGHIPGNYELFYQQFYDPAKWEEVSREPRSYFMAWRRKGRLPTLHIITTCFRLGNLRAIAKEIQPGTQYFDIQWHIIFDGEKVQRGQLYQYEDVLGMPFVKYKFQEFWPGERCPTSAKTTTPSFTAANEMLDQIKDGWVWIQDDDNLVHPDFFKALHGRLIEYPLAKGWVFGQQLKGGLRSASPNLLRVGAVDVAQYVLRKDLIGNTRYQMRYGSDGIFIEDIYRQHPADIRFDARILTRHNALT